MKFYPDDVKMNEHLKKNPKTHPWIWNTEEFQEMDLPSKMRQVLIQHNNWNRSVPMTLRNIREEGIELEYLGLTGVKSDYQALKYHDLMLQFIDLKTELRSFQVQDSVYNLTCNVDYQLKDGTQLFIICDFDFELSVELTFGFKGFTKKHCDLCVQECNFNFPGFKLFGCDACFCKLFVESDFDFGQRLRNLTEFVEPSDHKSWENDTSEKKWYRKWYDRFNYCGAMIDMLNDGASTRKREELHCIFGGTGFNPWLNFEP